MPGNYGVRCPNRKKTIDERHYRMKNIALKNHHLLIKAMLGECNSAVFQPESLISI